MLLPKHKSKERRESKEREINNIRRQPWRNKAEAAGSKTDALEKHGFPFLRQFLHGNAVVG